jgi:hypothetical protein
MNKPMTQADIYKAIEEIDEVVSKKLLAIEQAEKQESAVEHLWECLGRWSSYLAVNGTEANLAPPNWLLDAVIAATSQPRKEWVGLTDKEMSELYNKNYDLYDTDMTFMDFFMVQREVEAKLRSKNGY